MNNYEAIIYALKTLEDTVNTKWRLIMGGTYDFESNAKELESCVSAIRALEGLQAAGKDALDQLELPFDPD